MLDLVVLYEHPQWQAPLFAALERRGVRFAPFDLKRNAFDVDLVPEARLFSMGHGPPGRPSGLNGIQ